MKRLLLIMLGLSLTLGSMAQTRSSLLDEKDLSFLKQLTKDVMDSSRILPGQVISSSSLKNNTGGTLIRPGGRDAYPSFWIRDYAMSLETGMVEEKEQLHMLMLTASTQCDQARITRNGSMIPYGSIADHIRIDDGLPIYFPGTYDYQEQGNKVFGMLPPICDQFYFVHMAFYYVSSSGNKSVLDREINGKRLIDRLETAFSVVPSRRENSLVYTDSLFRSVDFGFRDVVEITGELCLSSILKYKAAVQLAGLFHLRGDWEKRDHYQKIADRIKMVIPLNFADRRGMLKASTGRSAQPDVWATALAVYYGILEGEMRKKACSTLSSAYSAGQLASRGNIRHILKSDDFSETTAWESALVKKNQYQNGAYWGTPTGWVCFAIAEVDPVNAQKLAKEYIDDLRETDFRKGAGYGGPYECFYLPDHKQNPIYLATVACPYIVFK